MPFEVRQYNNLPIIISVISRPFDFIADTKTLNVEGVKLIETIGRPVWSIIDFSDLGITFGELTLGLSTFTTSVAPNIQKRIVQFIFVGDSEMASIAAQGIQHDQYGGLPATEFATLDDALVFIQQSNNPTSEPE
jgi:hypothetical protein